MQGAWVLKRRTIYDRTAPKLEGACGTDRNDVTLVHNKGRVDGVACVSVGAVDFVRPAVTSRANTPVGSWIGKRRRHNDCAAGQRERSRIACLLWDAVVYGDIDRSLSVSMASAGRRTACGIFA